MVFIIIISLYSLLILVLAFGLARLEELSDTKSPSTHSISVVIAVRNETTIPDLSGIIYPRDKWELIVVDDSDHPGQLSIPALRSNAPGKKAAITTGITAAKGDLIVTTDADCFVQPQWLTEINKAFEKPGVKMVVGGVRIDEGKSFFSKLQSLEFVSVAATGAATLGLGFPTMCNGANLAYRREEFFKVNGFQGNERISSGDDEFLMNKFDKSSIRFLYSRDSVVSTNAASFGNFVSQRLRWAGKWSVNTSPLTRLFAVVVWLFHVAFIAMAISVVSGFLSWKLFVILAGAKIFVETMLLIPAANFFRVKWRWISFIVLQFVYSIYVIYVGFMSQVLLPKWKGRAVETKV